MRALFILLALLSQSAFGQTYPMWAEDVLGIDERVSLPELYESGQIAASVERQGDSYTADASAVIRADFHELKNASVAYDEFVEFGMPHLEESRIVEKNENEWVTWTHLKQSPLSSKHYLAVTILDELPHNPTGFAAVWHLIKQPLAEWPYENKPGFKRFNGVWYVERLQKTEWPDAMYVRYYVMTEVDTFMPSWLISGFVKSRAKSGVIQVIQTLAREASVRH